MAIACAPANRPEVSNPNEQGVRIEASDPPPGARWVGPIQASDGPDCAVLERSGTEARALAELRKTAVRQGIDFIKLTQVTKPHSDHVCVHKQYKIEGVGYRTAAAPALAPIAPASLPATCSPPCATGYACHAGTCEAECDPACGADQYCRFDRVCAPRR